MEDAIQTLTTKLEVAYHYLETSAPDTESQQIWDTNITDWQNQIIELEDKLAAIIKTGPKKS